MTTATRKRKADSEWKGTVEGTRSKVNYIKTQLMEGLDGLIPKIPGTEEVSAAALDLIAATLDLLIYDAKTAGQAELLACNLKLNVAKELAAGIAVNERVKDTKTRLVEVTARLNCCEQPAAKRRKTKHEST